MGGYRTTTVVRMRKVALERLRQLSRQQHEDMVDLLDLAVVLLEIEVAKPAATREVLPVKAAEVQFPLFVRLQGVDESIRVRASEEIRVRVREEK